MNANPPAKLHRCLEGKNHRYQRAPLGCKLCGKTTQEIHRLRAKWVNEMYAWRRRQNSNHFLSIDQQTK